VFAYVKEAIEQGNGYQAEPEQSTAIFQKVVACWRHKGFDPAVYLLSDAAALPATGLEIADVDFSFDYEQRLLLKEHLHPLLRGRGELDICQTYECAERVMKFVLKYPEKEFACEGLLPILCSDLAIKWHRNKCYAVMLCLVKLGFLRAVSRYAQGRSWLWRGGNKGLNKARRLEVSVLPPVSILSTFEESWAAEERSEVRFLEQEYGRVFGDGCFSGHVLLSG
jgi:hypothetical protein